MPNTVQTKANEQSDPVKGKIAAFGSLVGPKAGGPEAQEKERLVNVGSARATIKQAYDSDENQTRLAQFQAIQDAYDRISPDRPEDLEADGFKGLANVDWGGMQEGIDNQTELYLNLALEPEQFMAFYSRHDHKDTPAGLNALSVEISDLLRDWEELEDEFSSMIHRRSAFGLGIFHWPMPHSWHFQSLHPANLVTPKNAGLNPKKWPWFGIVTKFEIQNLIPKLTPGIKDAAESQGWNLKAIRQAIDAWNDAAGKDTDEKLDVEKIIDRFTKDGPGSIDASDGIAGFIYYVREWDGTISEYWISDQESVKDPLYKRQGRYRDMTKVIALFPSGLGDGYVMRVRGYGVNTLPYHDLENRHNNRTIDAAWLAASIGLKGDDEMLDRINELIIGPIFHVPDDLDVQQVAFQNQTQTLVQVAAMFDQKKASRNHSMGGNIDVSPNADRTATGAKLRYQEQTGARGGSIARFYRRLSMFWDSVFFRIADPEATETDPGQVEARQALIMAIRKGLPAEALATIYKVKAKRIFGDGDPNNLFLALSDLIPFLGRLSPGGQRFFIRHIFHSRLRNAPEVDAMLIDPELDDEAARQRQIAQGENADFQTSDVAITVSGTDDHRIHNGEHLIFAEDTVTQFENQRIPMEQAFSTLTRVREHNLGHLQALQQDELSEPIFRDANNRWAQIDNIILRLEQMLKAQQEAQQREAQEEARNPRPKVDELAKVATEELKQSLERQRASTLATQDESRHAAEMRKLDLETRMAEAALNGKIIELKQINESTKEPNPAPSS